MKEWNACEFIACTGIESSILFGCRQIAQSQGGPGYNCCVAELFRFKSGPYDLREYSESELHSPAFSTRIPIALGKLSRAAILSGCGLTPVSGCFHSPTKLGLPLHCAQVRRQQHHHSHRYAALHLGSVQCAALWFARPLVSLRNRERSGRCACGTLMLMFLAVAHNRVFGAVVVVGAVQRTRAGVTTTTATAAAPSPAVVRFLGF